MISVLAQFALHRASESQEAVDSKLAAAPECVLRGGNWIVVIIRLEHSVAAPHDQIVYSLGGRDAEACEHIGDGDDRKEGMVGKKPWGGGRVKIMPNE